MPYAAHKTPGFSPGGNRRGAFHIDLHILMCDNVCVATNLDLDDRLIERIRRTGGHKTKKEAVTVAMQEYARRLEQMKLVKWFGKVDFDPAYDYKAERRRKRG